MRSYFRILVLVSLFLPARVFGSWGFSAQLYENNCITTIPLTLPAISGFPNQSMCNAVRAEVLAIQESAPWEKSCGPSCWISELCTVGYTCSACTGSDDTFGTGTIYSLNPQGDSSGQPFFSPHYTADNDNWIGQTIDRFNTNSSANLGAAFPEGMVVSDDPYLNNVYQYMANAEYGDTGEASDYLAKLQTGQSTGEPGEAPGDLQESDFFFQLQTGQTGSSDQAGSGDQSGNGTAGAGEGNTPVPVDTTSLVVTDDSMIQQAGEEADQTESIAGQVAEGLEPLADPGIDSAKEQAIEEAAKAIGVELPEGLAGNALQIVSVINNGISDIPSDISSAANIALNALSGEIPAVGTAVAAGQMYGNLCFSAFDNTVNQIHDALPGMPTASEFKNQVYESADNVGQQAVFTWFGRGPK